MGRTWRTTSITPVLTYYTENVSELPKTTLLIAEFDGMRSDSEAYFKKLQKGGCQVSKILLLGECHLTILLRGVITEGDDPAKIIAEMLLTPTWFRVS